MQGFNHNFTNFFAIVYGFTHIFLIFVQNARIMALRIKELCKEKHTTMAEIAKQIKWKDKEGEHIGISPITLSQSLNGNPTLSRLQEVADILGVSVPELFETTGPVSKEIHGFIYVEGSPHRIDKKEDIIDLLNEL